MSSSESDSDGQLLEDEDSDSDHNVENDTDDGNGQRITTTIDNNHNIEDTNHFLNLYSSFQNSTSNPSPPHPIDHSFIDHISLAMNRSSCSSYVANIASNFGDCLDDYLFVPPLIQRTNPSKPFYFSYDPTISVSSSKLFVGNVTPGTTWEELKKFFFARGYGVNHVHVVHKPNVPGFAFVRFNNGKTATLLLHDYNTRPTQFCFRGRILRINPPRSNGQQRSNNKPTTPIVEHRSNAIDLRITDIQYGTLITRAAMRNIDREDDSTDEKRLGMIANELMNTGYNLPSRFLIDEQRKKFTILVRNNPLYDHAIATGVTLDLLFEWSFHDLKSDKIRPVLIDNRGIYLLLEVKRPPIILQKVRYQTEDNTEETRLPGTPSIGHANGWLFRLDNPNGNLYTTLFKVLRRYNLTPKQYNEENIIHLINLKATEKRRLQSIRLLSNHLWIQQNQRIVDAFRYYRWPSYPFETKFEIMKLISKHIITFHDLIVDEKAETILEQCSINALIACTDKIFEQASHWLSSVCDNDDEDWNQQDEREESDEDEISASAEHIPSTENDLSASVQFRSSTGASVTISNTEQIVLVTKMNKSLTLNDEQHVGTLSRLLLLSLQQLIEKHELRQVIINGMYLTKHESRLLKAVPFLIRKIYITPSTFFYEGPYREEKCAVTRHFEKQQDRFLRVTFRDEDYRVLHNYNDNMTAMYDRIKAILINGVTMCDRRYEFLAFSSSQLREHSCWMFATSHDGITAESIRQWMGDFSDARPVAKLAARLGQSFSTTVKGIKLESSQFRQISDITAPDAHDFSRQLCFTDGVGIIAPWMAEKLMAEVNPSGTSSYPSAFQIRCGGFKGMLCLDINNSIPPSNISVYFRDSMRKFGAQDYSIDVVRTSAHPSLAYLNRQIILLLSSLGISDDVFLSLQDRLLEKIVVLTEDPHRACETLRELNEYGGNGCHAFLIDYLRRLAKRKEPFARRILDAFKAFLVKELKTKAKILVPNSWSLLGVADETKTLEYGQVFIQIDNTSQQGGLLRILKGPVVVTRNPCFHPGDIRRLEAVDNSALHQLKNVIVFPVKGSRPHPMEMSGGDLDGDTFWICNNDELIFQSNEEPFRYVDQAVEAERKAQMACDKKFTIEDVCHFFGEYIAADNLGVIANSHLAFADQLPNGAKEQICLTLAKMHSTAVDFAKNGVSAPKLTRDLRPRQYPHYMEKRDKPSYVSTTILGQLYDALQSYKMDLIIDEKEEIDATFKFPYKSFHVDGYKDHLRYAMSTKNEYDRELKRVMRQYGIQTEVELVSGYILKFISKQYANEKKLFDLRNEISHAYRVIRDKYLRDFWEEFYQPVNDGSTDTDKWSEISKKLTWRNQFELFEFHHPEPSSAEEVRKKASAWFHITYDPWIKYMKQNRKNSTRDRNAHATHSEQGKQQRFKDLFSFAWVVYPVLFKIFDGKENNSSNDTELKKKKKKKKKTSYSTSATV